MMKKFLLLALLLTAAPSWSTESKTKHYCHNAAEWAKWIDLIGKYPQDDDLRAVYALRIGLCKEVDAGTIEVDRAIKIFDRFFEALKWQTQKQEEERIEKEGKKEKL